MNSQGGTYSAAAFSSSINQSKCQVTLSDPYMTGIAWPALFDASAMWSVSSMTQSNNIIMRQCGEGEDPVVGKCFDYSYIDESGDGGTSTPGEFKQTLAHLLVSLWYDVNGTEFGTDYYFRVSRIAISNGSGIPTVTISGTEPKAVVFNQNLVNLSFDEGMTVEDALKKIAEESGFTASFCTPPTTTTPQKYVLPRKVAYKGVTPDEAMKKILASTGGSMLSLPLKEHANKISVCSRGDLIQSCTVFYLGKGLYQSYEISGEPPDTFARKNTQQGAMVNNSDAYVSASFAGEKYKIQDVAKDKREKALASVKKVKFPMLFEPCEKRCQGPTKDGYGWAGAGPEVDNKKFTDSNMYGISPNGTKAISFLPGEVQSIEKEQSSVVIKTEFWLQIGKVDDSEKYFGRVIFQETTNLSEVKVKTGDKLTTSQEIGSSTEEKKEFTRFYVFGHDNTMVTIDPEIVWGFASPVETAATFAPKAAPVSSGGAGVVPAAPKAATKDWSPTTSAKPSKVLLTAGHADLTSSGAPNEAAFNIELVKWAQRNAAAYGVSDFVEFYFPPSGNLGPKDSRSQFAKTEQGVGAGKQVIEIHNDETNGKAGVIPPRAGNKIWPLDGALSGQYGSFSVNHRNGLGVPNKGGTILEVGRMDPPTQAIIKSGTPAQKEALYKQLMDPLMRSIAAEKSRQGSTAAPSAPSSAPATPTTTTAGGADKVLVGKIGDTGNSRGPHLHAEWVKDGRAITPADVYKYVEIDASGRPIPTSGHKDLPGGRENHKGTDIEADLGTPVYIKNGASVVSVQEGYSGGFGNNVIISTPEGEMRLAHLQDKTIPPGLPGLSTSASGGKNSGGVASAPSIKSLSVETKFKGVPRALRITPGRTILSFVTDYDAWLDEDGHKGSNSSIDPGVWIPQKFRNWFVTEVDFAWRLGDLVVSLTGANAWGNAMISAPSFSEYLSAKKQTGEFSKTNDYYGYIRSVGDLCYPIKKSEGGGWSDSCTEQCSEAQQFYQKYGEQTPGQEGGGTTPPGSVSESFPDSNCRTGDPTLDTIINALKSAGVKTQEGFAGVLANMEKESGVNFNIHNTARSGSGCRSTPSRLLGTTGYGLVQWCGSRADGIASKYGCGRNCSLDQQLSFLKGELETTYKSTVNKMNSAKTPEEAMEYFMREFEVPADPDFEVGNRSPAARSYFNKIKCFKP